ncbi:mitochondrial import inner membrane translocase subunit TIM22-4-like isoform X1 [Lycium ferocissimum]|uniref:mitochondrial import inner membrane translocase subunit TIM22-4-like isoform X1 n=1 Tax=Lycium ferocissimum TaxID=112874 RepID=UPI002814C420|nr:mitochondrial import inner membrane translocase subunit TIM22-4-like isoform X1 [Lycium ferocissimum]XP_059314928.1 mitochondrial import inner membrane translocase subunit TIM22-4-like isoform X1 [Lycium ferocissimum]XP_059314929.1 mitochondrial import inner membrane translocase subunit TIM22-4-like isoform X1 [Lycium ferocissimum]
MSDPATESNDAQSSSQEPQKPQIEPIRMPTVEEIRGQDIWNNCAVRSVVSGVMGGGLGLFMGMFLGALDNPIMQEEMTTRQQIVYQAKQMGRRSWSSCKTFAVMGLVFSAAECTVEKVRAKHDMTNTAVAGCVTGGTLSARGCQGTFNRTFSFNYQDATCPGFKLPVDQKLRAWVVLALRHFQS